MGTPNDIVALFNHFGRKGSGEVNFKQFSSMMQAMKIGFTNEQVLELFETFDVDNGGTVGLQEFIRITFPAAYCSICGCDDGEEEGLKLDELKLDELDNDIAFVPVE